MEGKEKRFAGVVLCVVNRGGLEIQKSREAQ